MDLAFSAADREFKQDVADFIATNLPEEIAQKSRTGEAHTKAEITEWQKILNAKGWMAPHWPTEYGGTGWSVTQRYLYDEAVAESAAPETLPFGTAMVGPVIYTFGTDDQKQHYLPRILSGEDWWCQGYSEPNAGSDLASLQTRAKRDGDHYIINGAKTWTSLAHMADWIFCLVRTSQEGKPQEGISFLLIDMSSPGIEIKPIQTIDNDHHVNMVFFQNVRVPVENRIGEENKGWTYAKFLLGNERQTIADVAPSKQRLRRLKELAGQEMAYGVPLLENTDFRRNLAEVEVELTAHEMTSLRFLAAEAGGKPVGPEASVLKIRGSEIRQRLTTLTLEAYGYYAGPLAQDISAELRNEPPVGPAGAAAATSDYMFSRASSIYGGTNEIQKGILAKMVLGL